MAMTYRQLLEELKKVPVTQLDDPVTVCCDHVKYTVDQLAVSAENRYSGDFGKLVLWSE